MNCTDMRELIPILVSEDRSSLVAHGHLAECPACSEELLRYEILLAALGSLEGRTFTVPDGLPSSLTAVSSRRAVVRRARGRAHAARTYVGRNKPVYVGGAAVALAGAAAAAWRIRTRRFVAA